MLSRRTFLKASGIALGASALPAFGQASKSRKTVLLQCAWAVKNIGDIQKVGQTYAARNVSIDHLRGFA